MHSRAGLKRLMKVKPLPSGAVDEPMTLWSAAGVAARGGNERGTSP
jgi:hypothetical protein